MGELSKIQWTDNTFNPWIGCAKVSPGCANCYAEEMMDKRYGRAKWGKGNPRSRTSESNWNLPLKWNRDAEKCGIRTKVFCASLADVFDDEVPLEWLADLFTLISKTPCLDWLILTKRPENIRPRLSEIAHSSGSGLSIYAMLPYSNIWLGVSVENQDQTHRIFTLQNIPAAIRFISCEPLLGNLDLFGFKFDWAIIGGESGANARPFKTDWARDIIDQCRQIKAAPFMKQLGCNSDIKTRDKKGGDITEFPFDLQVREFPSQKSVQKLK